MTSSLGDLTVRGRADELARRLDSGHAPALVQALRDTGSGLSATTVPRERFRADLRTRLMAVAAVQGIGAAAPALEPAPRAVAARAVSWRSASRAGGVAAGAMASVVAVTGVAVAGSQSLPGDPFYGVKRTTEALQLRFADGDLGKGTQHLELATERLSEVRGLTLGRDAADDAPSALALASSGTSLATPLAGAPVQAGAALGAPVAERVRETLADMDASTLKGQALLDAAFLETRDGAPLQALSRFATAQTAGLEDLIPALPAASRDRARTSLALVAEVAEETEQMLGSPACGPSCDPTAAAPTAPPVPGQTANPVEPTASPGAQADCGCLPAPTPRPSGEPVPSGEPEPTPTESPSPAPSGSPTPSGSPSATPSPSPTPTGGPAPLPLPSLPVPVPTLPLPPLPLPSLPSVPLVPEPVATLLPDLGPLQPVVDPLLPNVVGSPSPSPSRRD